MAFQISRLYDFQPGTKALSGQVDDEFNQLVDAHNDLDSAVAELKTAIDQIENEIKQFVGVNVNAEVGDARISTVKSKTFANLRDRLEESEQQINDLDDRLEESEQQINDLDAELSSQLAQKASRDDLIVERERINNLVANAGDTDGNAELLDLRVAWNGETYATAGDAVRSIGAILIEEGADW